LAIFKVFDSFQDLLQRGRSIAIRAFQFIDLRLEAASPFSAQPPSRSAGVLQKAFGACVRIVQSLERQRYCLKASGAD
jgi:hypothetical protein